MIGNPIRQAAEALAEVVNAEGTLRARRERLIADLTASIIGQHNPETGKPHSATSAREAAKALPSVLELGEKILDAECAIIRRRGEYEAARIEAWARVEEPA